MKAGEPRRKIESAGSEVAGGDEAEDGVLELDGQVGEGEAGTSAGERVELVEAHLMIEGVSEISVETSCEMDLLRVDTAEKRPESSELHGIEGLGDVDGAFVDEALQASRPGEPEETVGRARLGRADIDRHVATLLMIRALKGYTIHASYWTLKGGGNLPSHEAGFSLESGISLG